MIKEILNRQFIWYKIIMCLGKHKEFVKTKQITREIDLINSNLWDNLRNLKKKKIIIYKKFDNRSLIWRLSTKGRKIYKNLLQLEKLME